MADRPGWPPAKEDLERLYLVERLSAAKIAEVYGLEYSDPKVAESTVLYHLRRNGIPRRGRADHVRKVTPEMADGWAKRYQAGESLKKIAGSGLSPVTVLLHLRRRGVKLRDRVEAQIQAATKHPRSPFQGDTVQMAYLMGLRYGDLHTVRHGRAVRVRVSTTHPAMAGLFESLFAPYGYVHRYPREAELTGYEWTLECDLDNSFEFLLRKPMIADVRELDEAWFLAFLSGIFDAEGTIYLHMKKSWHNPEVWITNSDSDLLEFLRARLDSFGYHPVLRWVRQTKDRRGIHGESMIGRLCVTRFLQVQRLLRSLGVRHREKLARRDLALSMNRGSSIAERAEVVVKWKRLSGQIHDEVREFVTAARVAVNSDRTKGLSFRP